MRTIIFIALCSMLSLQGSAQTTIIGNNSSNSTDYLGWNTLTNFNLNIKHNGNQNIRFSTNNSLAAGILNNGFVLVGTTVPINTAQLSVDVPGVGSNKYGIYSQANGSTAYGGYFIGDNAPFNYGLVGTIELPASSNSHFGLYGNACSTVSNGLGVGIYGSIPSACSGASFAGYFDGQTFCTAGIWSGSDASLKTNVAQLEGSTEILTQLKPKKYNFTAPEGVEINLPQDLQYGLIAQELQLVVPHAVTEVYHGVRFESARIGIEQEFNFLGVNYAQLIPVLIAAFQERQLALYTEMESLIVLQQQIEEAEIAVAIMLAE